jgi:hypothetical protein
MKTNAHSFKDGVLRVDFQDMFLGMTILEAAIQMAHFAVEFAGVEGKFVHDRSAGRDGLKIEVEV